MGNVIKNKTETITAKKKVTLDIDIRSLLENHGITVPLMCVAKIIQPGSPASRRQEIPFYLPTSYMRLEWEEQATITDGGDLTKE